MTSDSDLSTDEAESSRTCATARSGIQVYKVVKSNLLVLSFLYESILSVTEWVLNKIIILSVMKDLIQQILLRQLADQNDQAKSSSNQSTITGMTGKEVCHFRGRENPKASYMDHSIPPILHSYTIPHKLYPIGIASSSH